MLSPFSAWCNRPCGDRESASLLAWNCAFSLVLWQIYCKKTRHLIPKPNSQNNCIREKLRYTHHAKSSSQTWRRNSTLSIEKLPFTNLVTIPLLNDATKGMPTPFWLSNNRYFISFSLETPIWKYHSQKSTNTGLKERDAQYSVNSNN